MGVLVALSLALCLAALIFMLHAGEAFVSALSFVVVLLVASIPIAIEIVGALRTRWEKLLAPRARAVAAADF